MSKPPCPEFGRYKVLKEIGRGSMGVVYQARDPKIERLVAIKSISLFGQTGQDSREFRERFFVEAKAAGRLSHPGIVTIYDVGEQAENQTPYIVMEHVAGESMEAMLSRNQGKLPIETALQLVQEIADALDYAHSKGIIHRDIKPSNILITENGHAKIADFGIAKLDLGNVTLTGQAFGTPAYMSPEQLNCDTLDGRSDLFSLGVILYAVLTGHRPFQGNSALTVSFRVVHREPLRASVLDSELPPDFDYVIERAMAKSLEHRYQSGMEMALDLIDLRDGVVPRSKLVGAPAAHGTGSISATGTGKRRLNPAADMPQAQLLKRVVGFVQNWPLWQYVSALVLLMGVFAIGYSASRNLASSSEQISATSVPHATGKQVLLPPPGGSETNLDARTPHKALPSNDKLVTSTPAAKTSFSGSGKVREVAAAPVAAQKISQQKLQSVNLKPAATPGSALHIRVEHHLAQGELFLWVDDQLAYKRPLGGTVTKRMVLFKGVEGLESDSVQIAAGDHRFRVRVQSADNKYDETRTINGTLPLVGERVLQIDCNKRKEMRLALQ